MESEREQQFNALFHSAIAALSRLQSAALKARHAATWAEAQQAQHLLAEAFAFDETGGAGLRRRGRGARRDRH